MPSENLDVVAAYAKTFGVSTNTAQERVALQRGVGDLPTRLEETLGDSFAGLWFDNSTGRVHIGIVPSARSTAATLAANANPLLTPSVAAARDFDVKRVGLRQLKEGLDAVNKALEPQLAQQLASTSLDVPGNAIRVELSNAASVADLAAVKTATDALGLPVVISRVSSESLTTISGAACGNVPTPQAACDRPLRGSVGIYDTSNDTYCSPSLFGRTSSGDFVVTAGHCASALGHTWNSYHWTTHTPYGIGQLNNKFWDSRGDLALVRISPGTFWSSSNTPNYVTQPEIGAWGEGIQDYASSSLGDPYVGLFFGWAGSTSSGFSTVNATNVTVTYDGTTTGTLVRSSPSSPQCVMKGTSGGPVWNTHVMYAVIAATDTACVNYSTPARQAKNIWGLTFYFK